MIKFKGDMSEKCKKQMLSRNQKSIVLVFSIISLIISIPFIILSITSHWIYIVCIPGLVLGVMLISRSPSEKDQNLIIPSEVMIKGEKIISKSDKFEHVRLISDVKQVIDEKEWYRLVFYYSSRNQYFICEKKLLVEGTIEEFEALFKNKLIRK